MTRILLAGLVVSLLATPAVAARNMVKNGSFEDGLVGWHIHLTDFMPETARDGDANRTYKYRCACGHDFGEYKPWIGLICPKCKGFISGEECGSWYVKNHERVAIVNGGEGRCMKFTLPTSVGNNQGVRVFSQLIKVKPGWGYKLTFYARAAGSIPRVFVECFAETKKEGSWNWDPEFNPQSLNRPLKKSYRAHVNCGSPTNLRAETRRKKKGGDGFEDDDGKGEEVITGGGSSEVTTPEPPKYSKIGKWQRYYKEIVAPARYRFEWMSVKLYAYMPGVAWFDNVKIEPMTASELRAFKADKNKRVKDKRFKY